MRVLLITAAALALPVSAAYAEQAPGDAVRTQAIAAIRDLGGANGQALACGEQEAAGRAKSLMLAHAPKSRDFGDAFDQGTRDAFAARTHGDAGACPDAAALTKTLDELAARLDKLLPAEPPAR